MNNDSKPVIWTGESAFRSKLFARSGRGFFYDLSTNGPALRRIDRVLVGIWVIFELAGDRAMMGTVSHCPI